MKLGRFQDKFLLYIPCLLIINILLHTLLDETEFIFIKFFDENLIFLN